MAHIKKSATTGHILKNANGHMVKGCVAAPCECPDGLDSSYVVKFDAALFCDQNCITPLQTCTSLQATVTTSGSCQWAGSVMCVDETLVVTLELVTSEPCVWLIGTTAGNAEKSTGLSPVGSYSSLGCKQNVAGWSACGPFNMPPHGGRITNISVS